MRDELVEKSSPIFTKSKWLRAKNNSLMSDLWWVLLTTDISRVLLGTKTLCQQVDSETRLEEELEYL
jgi:hypothetical protein